jgi:histidinol-phosphate phosphatase family protein
MSTDYTVVIPTTGRESLSTLLSAVDGCAGPRPARIIVVDDRPAGRPLALPAGVRVVRSWHRGPAAARNAGWRQADTEWVAFLDDDVIVSGTWAAELADDLAVDAHVGASQGRILVPIGSRPTDDERGTAGLAAAQWITADMAYRRRVLAEVGGFDERFPRAFREDSDLALRVVDAGHAIVRGNRRTTHPARQGGFLASVHRQAGNADNALMRRKHGPRWRERTAAGPSMLGRHALTTVAGIAAVLLAGPRRTRRAACVAAALWFALTGEFAKRRIQPGPRTVDEVTRMIVTSALIPPAACAHRLAGELRTRRAPTGRPAAVLFDRDDTLIADVPYLDDPTLVAPMPGAARVLRRLRAAGIRVGVVSNQSGVARGLISPERLAAVNARVEELLGPFGTWQVCVHGDADGCPCRKPQPGLVRQAAEALGVDPRACVVIGDTGADVAAAEAAGARGILVPTDRTLPEEIRAARQVATDLTHAVKLAMKEEVAT